MSERLAAWLFLLLLIAGCGGGPVEEPTRSRYLVVTAHGDSVIVLGTMLGRDNQTFEVWDKGDVVFRAPRNQVRFVVEGR